MAKEAKKITQEELTKLQEVVNKLNQSQMQLGLVEIQKHELCHGIVEVQKDLINYRKELEEKYGNVSIAVNDGTITEKEQEDAASDKKD